MALVQFQGHPLEHRGIPSMAVQENKLTDTETVKLVHDPGHQIVKPVVANGDGAGEINVLVADAERDRGSDQDI